MSLKCVILHTCIIWIGLRTSEGLIRITAEPCKCPTLRGEEGYNVFQSVTLTLRRRLPFKRWPYIVTLVSQCLRDGKSELTSPRS